MSIRLLKMLCFPMSHLKQLSVTSDHLTLTSGLSELARFFFFFFVNDVIALRAHRLRHFLSGEDKRGILSFHSHTRTHARAHAHAPLYSPWQKW